MKRKHKISITESTLIAALRKAVAQRDERGEGLTVSEIAQESGAHVVVVRRHLKIMIEAGQCTTGFQYRPSIAGYLRRIPVYLIKKKV